MQKKYESGGWTKYPPTKPKGFEPMIETLVSHRRWTFCPLTVSAVIQVVRLLMMISVMIFGMIVFFYLAFGVTGMVMGRVVTIFTAVMEM